MVFHNCIIHIILNAEHLSGLPNPKEKVQVKMKYEKTCIWGDIKSTGILHLEKEMTGGEYMIAIERERHE